MRTFYPIHVFKIWPTDCITSAIRKDKDFFLYSSKEKQLFLQDLQGALTQQKKKMDPNSYRRYTMTLMSRVWLTTPCSGLGKYWGCPGNPSQGTRGTFQNTFPASGWGVPSRAACCQKPVVVPQASPPHTSAAMQDSYWAFEGFHIFPANAKPEPMLKATLYLLIPNKQMCWGGQAPGWSEDRLSQDMNSPAGWCGSAVGPIRRGVGCQSLLVSLGTVGRLVGTKGYPTFLPGDH